MICMITTATKMIWLLPAFCRYKDENEEGEKPRGWDTMPYLFKKPPRHVLHFQVYYLRKVEASNHDIDTTKIIL